MEKKGIKLVITLIVTTVIVGIILIGGANYLNRKKSFCFKIVHRESGPNRSKVKLEATKEELFVDNYPSLTIDDIYSAYLTVPRAAQYTNDNEWIKEMYDKRTELNIALNLVFTEKGRAKLAKVTSENVGKRLGIFIYGKLLTAPKIIEPIVGGSMVIRGMTQEETASIAERINKLKKQSPAPK